ncbi:shikimate dehydrogenase [Variovorax sp. J22G21]|uniref:shikimate dehydrogenase family protein n=1 Tax=Variovorax fucosicus TaxID=3053517 RepID=UPI002577A91B|nr:MULTISPECIES: shikimate dehydrogenase [unclassified Variovorax]MDM0041265.1 shikimate dehydrogenase [Variovorax sp. J22R193]MDM0057659.1 shikimate dehydrogenase [Variovorax sp. J22G47]MDM0060322.1 shikimate dehydrogenase [Variovorax sp. J22G21]
MMAQITGSTRLYGLVGDPLTTAKSPELLNRLFIEQRADAVCVPFAVKDDDLPAFVTGARALGNLSGVLVTMPHKQRMLSFVDELHPTARQVGALNVIRCDKDGRWVGAIFDGLGCVLGMQWEGNDPVNKSVLLVGAGGAGRAIAFAVASAGARALTIFDIDERRADELATSVAAATGCTTNSGSADPCGFEIVINATPLGMRTHDPLPVNPERLDPGSIVVDIINAPEPTPLCRAADARGCRTQGGRPMHEGQALHALRFLGFDYRPDGKSLPNGPETTQLWPSE